MNCSTGHYVNHRYRSSENNREEIYYLLNSKRKNDVVGLKSYVFKIMVIYYEL